MKHILFLLLLSFANLVFAAEEETHISFNKENAKYWQYISDRTMGGISDGQALLEQDGDRFFARLTGDVSTKNNGGFIQLRSNLLFSSFQEDVKKIKGVRLKVRGNGEIYHVFIRTDEARSYSDYYAATFKANTNWEIIDLPFNQFINKFSINTNLNGKNVRTFAIVAYGREFKSDVSVSQIIFYY